MDELRDSLVGEQKGLCCYCMGRIHSGPLTMKVEHWLCQSANQDEQLNYRNLLGACLGGQGQPADLQHCDTCKGDQALQWSPANPDHRIESRIRYEMDGSIRSDDPDFDTQLERVLNLNLKELKNNRKAVFDAIQDWWKREKTRLHTRVPRQQIERMRREYAGGTAPLRPYCQVAVWLLDQRLARMAP